MRLMTVALAVMLTVASLPSIRAQERNTAAGTAVTYEEFMGLDVQGRIRRFNEITAENRAEIVRTQAERWLARNRDRLSSEQVAVMQENIAFISARIYELPRTPEITARAKELEAKSAALLSRDDIAQALTVRALSIPR